ncbi:MAG: hypothetical protein M3336_14645 [Chloroflexota bacterium]|nr:hypothetical protein [Chloroflexota bacterium]
MLRAAISETNRRRREHFSLGDLERALFHPVSVVPSRFAAQSTSPRAKVMSRSLQSHVGDGM